MAVEVIPGVWWLEGTRGCNVYVTRADDGSFVVIDPGFRRNAAAVVAQVQALAAGAAVSHVLLTHGHLDHAAAAEVTADALGARVAIGAGDAEPDGDGGLRVIPSLLRRRRRRALPAGVRVDEVIEERREVAPGIEAIPTPGHTAGSTCFIARAAGVSFVGDLVISHADGLARSHPAANLDDAQYLDTLRQFAGEATEVGLAGHGHAVGRGFAAALGTLAALPRDPASPRVMLRRAVRLARFATWVGMTDRPPRRPLP